MCTSRNALRVLNLILIGLLALAVNSLSASDDKVLESRRYRSVRAMGMGNAFAAIADDGDAFYYNPAGLTAAGKLRVDFQPVRLIPTQDLYGEIRELNKLMDDMEAISGSESPLEDPTLEDERRRLTQRMKRLSRENLGLDAAIPFRVIVPLHIGGYGVAIGGIMHGRSESQFHVQQRGLRWTDFVKDVLDDEMFYDIMAETSYGLAAAVEVPVSSLPIELSLGLAVRRTHRWWMTDEDDLLGIEDLFNPYGEDGIEGTADDFRERYFDPEDPWDSVSESRGYNVDIGTIVSLDDTVNIAIVVQDLAGKIEDAGLTRNYGLSAAVNLTELPILYTPKLDIILAAGLERRDETRGNAGLELVWKLPLMAVSGRIGSNHGKETLGAGIQLAFLDFDYAFYGEQDTNWHAFSLNLAF